jgi:hypothetical protein
MASPHPSWRQESNALKGVVMPLRTTFVAAAVAALGAVGAFAAPANAVIDPNDPLVVEEGQTKTYVIEDGAAEVVASVRADPPPDPSVQACWIGTIDYTRTSLGTRQFTWRHEVHWCFNGSRAAGAHVNTGVNVYNDSKWRWLGNAYPVKHNMSTHMDVGLEGKYQFCVPNCWQTRHPLHRGDYYRGRFVTTLGHT